MLQFETVSYLYLLLLIPIWLLSYYLFDLHRKKLLLKLGDASLLARLTQSVSMKTRWLKRGILMTAFMFCILALANPQYGSRMEEVKREGVDILIALDVSKSMLAEDIAPNRLNKAKYEIREFISKLKGDRIGLIPFAGIAYTHCPLTLDYGAALLFLDFINEKTIPYQGTSIASALETAINSFPEKNKKYKVLVIITDGEDHEEGVEALALKAKENGIVIYTVGLGSLEGVPIPEYNASGERIGYKKDRNGDIVLTKLNDQILKDIAFANKGRFFHVTPQNPELDMIHQEISLMEKQEYGEKQFSSFEARYQYLLIIAILLIFIDFLISERAKSIAEWKGRFL